MVHTPLNRHPARSGNPISPQVDGEAVLVRYMYDGGVLSQGRLCLLQPNQPSAVTGQEVLRALSEDGVDLDRFYACVYETVASNGGWLPIGDASAVGSAVGDASAAGSTVTLPLKDEDDAGPVARRIDVRLMRRDVDVEAHAAEAAGVPCGDLAPSGYHAIGVVNTKNQANVGTLWRSAFQLGAQYIFTVGTRYRHQPTDTVRAVQRMPLFEYDSWSHFAESSPKGARWVAVEMGGTPLEEFEHPLDAVYLLGSEDAGLPKAIVRACHDVVSLSAVEYASYNVAVAGSIVLYDRLTKDRKRRAAAEGTPDAADPAAGGQNAPPRADGQ